MGACGDAAGMRYRDTDHPPFDEVDPGLMLTNMPGFAGHHLTDTIIVALGNTERPNRDIVLHRSLDHPAGVTGLLRGAMDALDPAAPGDYLCVYVISRRWPQGLPDKRTVARALGCRELRLYLGVTAITGGAPVTDHTGEVVSHTGDPAASNSARRLAEAGEALVTDVIDIDARFAADTSGRVPIASRAQHLAQADCDTIPRSFRRIIDEGEATTALEWVGEWDTVIEVLRHGDESIDDIFTDEHHLRALARPLLHLSLRDLTLACALTPDADLARLLWLEGARVFTGFARANALGCYGLDRWRAGVHGVAERAFRQALDAYPEHSLSLLMLESIAEGLGDQAVNTMLEASRGLLHDIEEAAAWEENEDDDDWDGCGCDCDHPDCGDCGGMPRSA